MGSVGSSKPVFPSCHFASTAVMDKTAVPSQQATLCLETPVMALSSIWRWLTHVTVSISNAYLAVHSGTAGGGVNKTQKSNAMTYQLLV